MEAETRMSQVRAWASDFPASVVVFLVALPLCMGIAVASGVPPALGLLTGIVGGLVVGALGGAPLQVSGPAAGLTVLVWDIVQRYGLGALGPLVLLAGALQIGAALLRGGRWFQAVPASVIHGMLAGIGVLIVASQFHVMVDDAPAGSGLDNLVSIPLAVWKATFPADGTLHQMAAAIGLETIVVIVLWSRFARGRLKVLPPALVGVVMATLTARLWDLPIARVAVPDSLAGSANWISLAGALEVLRQPAAIGEAVALALIASAETLLCATAVDRMHNGPRTHYDRELGAQGLGNILCGVLGALPMTGVIVRSSANVQAGGKTRASAIMHGLWLLGLVWLAPGLLRYIPVASLAAVLVFTGFKLMNLAVLRSLRKYGRSEVAIYLGTVIAIIVTDLLKGILFGLVLALAKLLWRFSHLRVQMRDDHDNGRTVVQLTGAATFLSLPNLAAALQKVPEGRKVEVHVEALDYIDHACLEALAEWEKQHRARGGQASINWKDLEFRYRERKPAAAPPRWGERPASS